METSGTGSFSSPSESGSKPLRWKSGYLPAAILLLAFVLRLTGLGVKPPHFDEGVNGWFVDEITKTGFYHYDPGNFHGPLHFYLLFLAQTLFGRHIWALRLPVALISIGCVAMVFAFRRYIERRACVLTALAMAVSPGMVFYGRYAIHETELVFFMMLAVWGGAGLLSFGKSAETPAEPVVTVPAKSPVSYLWAFGLGIAGMIVTKETYAIHLIAFLLAFPALWILEWIFPSSGPQFGWFPWRRHQDDACNAALVSLGVILFFYTACFLDWSSLPGLWQTFQKWGATGTSGESGHEKAWYYWLELLLQYEWCALLGLVATIWFLWPRSNRFIRYLAIAGMGALVAYSIIAYKTPWCILAISWPFFFVFGAAFDRLASRFQARFVIPVAALVIAASFIWSLRLNFRHFTDEQEPYVYVQTTQEIRKLLDPLRWLTAQDPVYYHISGHVLIPMQESHPIPWLLGDFTHVDYLDAKNPPPQMDADFLLVDDSIVSDVEERLSEPYFKESFLLRGDSGQFVTLYLRASTFARYFTDRTPEFSPPAVPSKLKQETDQ